MILSRSSFLIPLTALGIAALTAPRAHAQFTFTNIADTNTTVPGVGAFTGFSDPRISGSTVAFSGIHPGESEIYTGSGGALTTIVKNGTATPVGGSFNTIGAPSISGNNVAFISFYSGGPGSQGAFVSSGGSLTAIATNGAGSNAVPGGGTFNNFSGQVISGSNVAFAAQYSNGTSSQGIFANTGAGGALQAIATTASPQAPGGGTFSNFFSGIPTISGSNVAFKAQYSGGTGSQGIFANTGAGGALQAIATDGSPQAPGGGTFSFFGLGPSISGSNVAFLGGYSGGTGSQGIFVGSGGSLTAIATNGAGSNAVPGGGTFSNFFATTSMSGSNVAFMGIYSGGTGSQGIFLEAGGSLNKVISNGDALFGSTVTDATISPSGLDGNTVAFSYSLADGRKGVATASFDSVVPEPGTLALLALGGLGILARRR